MPSLGIRAKAAWFSVLLLAVPVVGYQYVRAMERFLRDGLEESVRGAAEALAAALHERADLLTSVQSAAASGAADVYAHPLEVPPAVDGYARDWEALLPRARPLGPPDAPARLLAGRHRDHLYILLRVRDQTAEYAAGTARTALAADHLRLHVGEPGGRTRTYVLATASPGWMRVHETASPAVDGGLALPIDRLEPRIHAELRRTTDGYDMEIRAPISLLGPRLGVEVFDGSGLVAGKPIGRTGASPGALVLPSPALARLLRGADRTPGRQVRIVDGLGRVIASGGQLDHRRAQGPAPVWLRLLLSAPDTAATTGLEGAADPALTRALAGNTDTRWRTLSGDDLYLVTAVAPIWRDREVVGAVVAEQTTRGIQTVRYRALGELIVQTLLVIGGGSLALALFASRITTRLVRLRNEAEDAIDEHGRVIETISGSDARDEIGDLARSFAGLTRRLASYNRYLEQLSRRLSHELRTPVTVVRSSLESMTSDGRPDEPYLERAREGVARLDAIISRMSEASRLEEALASSDPERFDLAGLARMACAGYATAWPTHRFEADIPDRACPVVGAPDLVAQALDKLVSNAIEFSDPDTPIRIGVARESSTVRLSVTNHGPPLPDMPASALFDSMVSIRVAPGRTPHLGLGLYIVRLVAEHHRGTVDARTVGDRVEVSLTLAQADPAPPAGPSS